jgi:hypothetical protein
MSPADFMQAAANHPEMRVRFGWSEIRLDHSSGGIRVTLACGHKQHVKPRLASWMSRVEMFDAFIEAAEDRPCSCIIFDRTSWEADREQERELARRPDLTRSLADAVWAAEYVRARALSTDADAIRSANAVIQALKECR